MTDAERALLTEHLATKVLGWQRWGASSWRGSFSNARLAAQRVWETFDPLTRLDDMMLVMEAWQKKGNGLSIDMDAYAQVRPWTVTTNYGDDAGACSDAHETMTEAVCVAIYRASREGERS